MAKIKGLRNSRSATEGRGFAKVPVEMMEAPAFQSLAASSIKVLLYSLRLNYGAATDPKRPKGSNETPSFAFTNKMARDLLGMNQQTFTNAKKELAKKGFIKWAVHGGMKGCNGIASRFVLSSRYKDWTPPDKSRSYPGLEKARAALKGRVYDQ